MSSQYPRAYRGMQVHAVPDNEKAYDANGRKLPWGYAVSGNFGNEQDADRGRDAIEKGPFGRSMRRARGGTSRSRSKTAEPRREEDRLKAEQLAAEDAVFGSLRRVVKDDPRRETANEGDTQGDGQSIQLVPGANTTIPADREPTEILLYGFGQDLQWAAIDFYERVSDGTVLEDYDRVAPGYGMSNLARPYDRIASQRSLGKAALRKKNSFAGGNHWIKITFDSRPAAELACARSPHIIKGHLVYAEPFFGRGPARDEPIYASQAGVQVTGVLPATFATTQPSLSGGTSTATSATALNDRGSVASSTTMVGERNQVATTSTEVADTSRMEMKQIRRPRIEGAIPVKLLPAEQALMPKQPKQSWVSSLGARELIGSAVPKKADGSFDWDGASFYWRIFYFIDLLFGTDFCGITTE